MMRKKASARIDMGRIRQPRTLDSSKVPGRRSNEALEYERCWPDLDRG